MERNYGCGIPPELKNLAPGKSVLDLGPGLGRDCFIAARKVGAEGTVYGLDMNEAMLVNARSFKKSVVQKLGWPTRKPGCGARARSRQRTWQS